MCQVIIDRQEYDDLVHCMRNRIVALRGVLKAICLQTEKELALMEAKLNEITSNRVLKKQD